ncbi:rod shape-determining protein MreD [Thalassoporum mexicanum PCC 7367]|uniref:rod shape-determining protein MreD n=1 Tax=Thalassoporum mexicanum TaxID=3457544 RepID=UPI00029F9825|nr:rod shape-determining protein MreD [Pseudanabaena sp. PCC 7367]AFY70495.1 rod shape-determining protein MreD [Pseudanabaena sp. PCC 7367]
MLRTLEKLNPRLLRPIGWLVTLGSLFLCLLLMPLRLPGFTLFDLAPNWLLIWLVTWSINKPVVVAAIAGVSVGLLQDAMTIPGDISLAPTRAISMALVAILTALLQKQRYVQEDFVSIALIVFGMSVVSETAIALQLTVLGRDLSQVWLMQQRITLTTAVLNSLWSPALYFPLSRWWRWLEKTAA